MQVQFERIHKTYGDFTAVNQLDLTIREGALHFILGPSGCGKTTTLRMLAGLESPDSGRILIGGQDVTNLSAQQRGIGMVFQNYALWPHMNVRKNIEYGLKLQKLAPGPRRQRLDEVVAITRLDRFLNHLPGQLSGGQQQRVALARALAVSPAVLLLDEPLSNLDTSLRLEMRENINRIHRETGITMVYVTHDQKEALSLGTHISVMYAGRLLPTGSPRQLYNEPGSPFVAGFISETNLIPGTVHRTHSGHYAVRTSLGLLQTACTGSFQEGDEVVASLRPEAIRIGGKAMAPNTFRARLLRRTYLGDSEQFRLQSGEDDTEVKVTVYHGAAGDCPEGTDLLCRVAPADIHLLAASETLGPGT